MHFYAIFLTLHCPSPNFTNVLERRMDGSAGPRQVMINTHGITNSDLIFLHFPSFTIIKLQSRPDNLLLKFKP